MARLLRVAAVLCVLALGLCLAASAMAAPLGSRPRVVIDNFDTGRSRTEVTGLEPSLLSAGSEQDALAGLTPAEAGPRKVAVLLVGLPGQSFQQGWSAGEARSKVFTAPNSANAFYAEESYGEITLTGKLRSDGDVFGQFGITPNSSGCAYEEWDEEANRAAENAGVDLSGYGSIVYDFPLQLSCDWSGIAGVGGSWVNINGNASSGVVAHELGHNLGLEHAGSWTCTEGGVRVQISDTCTVSEYGDPFDTMGNAAANRHNSGWNLEKLGILGPQNIETVTESGTYSIQSALTKTKQPTVLRIARSVSPSHFVRSWYYLEIRQSGGVFESGSDAAMSGVSIRATAEGGSPETLLLDANPSTATFADAPLQPGETFDGGRVQVKTVSAGAGKATVEVHLNTAPPAAPDDLHATVDANGVHLDWDDADSTEVKNYFVYRDGEQVANTFSREALDFRPVAGQHEYTVVAADEEENHSVPSAPLTVSVPFLSGPTCAEEKCKVAYLYSGAPATWTVPPGVSEARVTAEGGRGGGRAATPPERVAGAGARIWATLGPLTPGQQAQISVGGKGESHSEGGAGGFNGGGDGGLGGGGGGYTKLELESTLEVLAAGGGGSGLDGHNGTLIVTGGRGGNGGEEGDAGIRGAQTPAAGATLKGGGGGPAGDSGGGGGRRRTGHRLEQLRGRRERRCVRRRRGKSQRWGWGRRSRRRRWRWLRGGGQGGGGAADACGSYAATGGGGGGSSFVAPGHLEDSETAGEGNGWLGIEYDDPINAAAGEYMTLGGQELDIPADRGVLVGASGPGPASLSATLVDPPASGSLDLKPDGSFTYTPEPGFLGSDSFVFRVAAGTGDYAEATVTLNVAGPPSATVTSPSPNGTYVVGEAVATAFSCDEGTAGPGLLSCDDSNSTTSPNGATGHLDTTTVGHHTYTVTAVSKDGLTGEASFVYEVVPGHPVKKDRRPVNQNLALPRTPAGRPVRLRPPAAQHSREAPNRRPRSSSPPRPRTARCGSSSTRAA